VQGRRETVRAPVGPRQEKTYHPELVEALRAPCSRVLGAALDGWWQGRLENYEAGAYVQQVMERAGVSDALRRCRRATGDTVIVGEREFESSESVVAGMRRRLAVVPLSI